MQFFDQNGFPCSGCKLYTYAAGTTTPQVTYTSISGTTQNTNPVIPDASGSANVWIGPTPYKFVLQNAFGTQIWSSDNVSSGSGGGGGGSAAGVAGR